MNEQNNFLMAVILSLAVLLGWQFFVTEPRLAEERAAQKARLVNRGCRSANRNAGTAARRPH